MKLLTPAVTRTIKQSVVVPKLLISKLCPLPNFLIIGAQKSGTTSLYDYMTQHPRIARAMFKEVHFFDFKYDKGINWYRSHFPVLLDKRRRDYPQITGEASPAYIFHPQVPERVYKAVPGVKLIVILRNPVDRAYSQYNHKLRNGSESRSFEEALEREEREEEVLSGERKKMLNDQNYRGLHYFEHAYLARGRYVEQLKAWSNYFPKEQMLILKSEDFYEDPSSTLQQVYKFLDLPAFELEHYKNRYPGHYTKMSAETMEYLMSYFKPHNTRLNEFLGVDFGWSR